MRELISELGAEEPDIGIPEPQNGTSARCTGVIQGQVTLESAPTLPTVLVVVHGLIGLLENGVGVYAPVAHDHPRTDADFGGRRHGEVGPTEFHSGSFQHCDERRRLSDTGADDDELITTYSADDVGVTERLQQGDRRPLDEVVARRVTVAVVDGLQSVQIQVQEAETPILAAGAASAAPRAPPAGCDG